MKEWRDLESRMSCEDGQEQPVQTEPNRTKTPGKGCYIVQNALWGTGMELRLGMGMGMGLGLLSPLGWPGRAIAEGRKKCFNVFRLIFCTFLRCIEAAAKPPNPPAPKAPTPGHRCRRRRRRRCPVACEGVKKFVLIFFL